MKRRNVQQAFVGEGDYADQGPETLLEGDEAVEIEVIAGTVMVVVPAGTSDRSLLDARRFLGGELRLEDGSLLTFSIEGDAIGAQVGLAGRQGDTHEGLSTLPHIPAGT